jgi:hypothetical protein
VTFRPSRPPLPSDRNSNPSSEQGKRDGSFVAAMATNGTSQQLKQAGQALRFVRRLP